MKAVEKKTSPWIHLRIQETATEPQAVISWGEEILNRVHNLAHEIEEHVQQALNTPTYPSPHPADPSCL
jgi:hypothetical protein